MILRTNVATRSPRIGSSQMPKPVTTNEQIARGIVEVLNQDNMTIEQLMKKVPRQFWDKVRDAMGTGPPDKGTISARWNRPSSGPQIRRLVEAWLSNPSCRLGDTTCDPHVIEPYADIETDPSEDLDPSMVVDLDAEDLVSMGVMTEPIGNLDTCDLDCSDSVDLYGQDGTGLVDTIDIETETWAAQSCMVSTDTIAAVSALEGRLTARIENLAQELETQLTYRLQTLVQEAVQAARAIPSPEPAIPDWRGCPVPPRGTGKAKGKKVAVRVAIDANLYELFDAECRLRFHGNAAQAMNEILWRHYDKPKLSFEPS